MDDLNWLTECSLISFQRRDYDWVITFNNESHLVVSCLWRLTEDKRIRRTSNDHGQKFGLQTVVDAGAEVHKLLSGTTITNATLNPNTLDLELDFRNGLTLQILPDSSGYEAWTAGNSTTEYIAVGGGRLDKLPVQPRGETRD